MAAADEELDPMWQQFLDDIYNRDLKAGSIDKTTGLHMARNFMKAVKEGFGNDDAGIDYGTPNYAMFRNLERNTYQFAGAKDFEMIRSLNDLLRDGDRLRSRGEFRKEAQKLLGEMNGTWKNTEYNTAVNGAQNSANWVRFEENRHIMPLLRFTYVDDGRECAICRPHNNVVRHMDDPYWNYASPSLHFGDRCTLLQLASDVPVTPDDHVPGPEGIPQMFRVNLAKEGLAFPPGHPYYRGMPKRLRDALLPYSRPEMDEVWSTVNTSDFEDIKGNPVFDHLPDVEQAAINHYTGSYYRDINMALREGYGGSSEKAFREIIEGGLENLPIVEEPVILRGEPMNGNKLGHYRRMLDSGKTVHMKAFTSCTIDDDTALQFSAGDKHRVIFSIHHIDGRDVRDISQHQNEYEIILKAGSKFKVDDIEERQIRGRVIQMITLTQIQ